jgi:hypothetical protein
MPLAAARAHFTERELVEGIAAGRIGAIGAEGRITRAEGRALCRLTDGTLRQVIHWQVNRIWPGFGGLVSGRTRVRVEILIAVVAPPQRQDSPTVRLARLMKAARDRRRADGKDTSDWSSVQAFEAVKTDYPDHELVRGRKSLTGRSARKAWALVETGKV